MCICLYTGMTVNSRDCLTDDAAPMSGTHDEEAGRYV